MVAKKYKKNSAIILATIAVITLALIFFAAPKNNPIDSIDIYLPKLTEHLLFSYVWIAHEQGFFEEEGLDVNLIPDDDANIPALVSSGPEFPIGIIQAETLFEKSEYASQIIPLDIFLYGASDTSSYDTHFVVGKQSGINTVADLKGKTIRLGFPPTRIALKNILKEAGLTLDDVNLISASAHATLDLIRKGELDGAITYFTTMPVMLVSGDVTILKKNVFSNYVLPNVPQSIIGINKVFATENPKIVLKFLRAMQKAYDYGEKNPTTIITSFLKLKQIDVDSWVNDPKLIEEGASLIPKVPIKQLDSIYIEDGEVETVFESFVEYQELLHDEGKYKHQKVNLQPLWDNYIAFKNLVS